MPPATSGGWSLCVGRELGFIVDEARALLRLAASDENACAEIRTLAAEQLTHVCARIADLRSMKRIPRPSRSAMRR